MLITPIFLAKPRLLNSQPLFVFPAGISFKEQYPGLEFSEIQVCGTNLQTLSPNSKTLDPKSLTPNPSPGVLSPKPNTKHVTPVHACHRIPKPQTLNSKRVGGNLTQAHLPDALADCWVTDWLAG